MDLALVVVSYNTRRLTCDCLASIYTALANERIEAEVWVVDNASGDGSADMVRNSFPQAHLIASADNLGFAGGTNLALAGLNGLTQPPRYVLLLNPDTLVQPQALSRMVTFLDDHPEVGVVGARLSYGDGSFQHSAFRFPTLAMAFFDFWPIHHRLIESRLNGRYSRRLYEAGEPFPIDHPLGAALMMRWETLQQVGPLDDGYFMYCEEVDWCMRVKKAGWSIYCVPEAQIVHLEGQSTRQFRDKMFVALWRSRYRLFERHYGKGYRLAVRRIVRWGLARVCRRTESALKHGDISAEAAQKRLQAYRQVMEM